MTTGYFRPILRRSAAQEFSRSPRERANARTRALFSAILRWLRNRETEVWSRRNFFPLSRRSIDPRPRCLGSSRAPLRGFSLARGAAAHTTRAIGLLLAAEAWSDAAELAAPAQGRRTADFRRHRLRQTGAGEPGTAAKLSDRRARGATRSRRLRQHPPGCA